MNINNNKGIVLLITLIVVALVMMLGAAAFYISRTATKSTALYKQFNSGLEAVNAAYQETRYIIDYIKVFGGPPLSPQLDCTVVGANFLSKLSIPTDSSSVTWQGDAQNPDTVVSTPDIRCTNIGGYNVYVKLINTSQGDTATGRKKGLNSAGVTSGEKGRSVVFKPIVPYLYNFIIEARRTTPPYDNVSVMLLYGY